MQQIDTGHYTVTNGEDITLTIIANKVAEDLAVSLDGASLAAVGHGPAVYRFKITKASGAQFVDIQCHFSAPDPDDAYYQFYVQGSAGGGKCNASSIRKTDDDWDAVLQFSL